MDGEGWGGDLLLFMSFIIIFENVRNQVRNLDGIFFYLFKI